jgi:hypothetical protein
MEQRDITREISFAVIEEKTRVGIIQVGPHFIGIGIDRQHVECDAK